MLSFARDFQLAARNSPFPVVYSYATLLPWLMHMGNEREEVEARQTGEAVLTGLFEQYFDRVARYAYVRIGDRAEAENIAGEVFLHAAQSIASYKERGVPMSAWLFKIAHNLVVDHLRRVSKRRTDPFPETDVPDSRDSNDPVQTTEANIELETVTRAMRQLTDAQRQVVDLRFFADLSSHEVAVVLKKSDGAVREMQSAALEKLRQLLGPNPDEGEKHG